MLFYDNRAEKKMNEDHKKYYSTVFIFDFTNFLVALFDLWRPSISRILGYTFLELLDANVRGCKRANGKFY